MQSCGYLRLEREATGLGVLTGFYDGRRHPSSRMLGKPPLGGLLPALRPHCRRPATLRALGRFWCLPERASGRSQGDGAVLDPAAAGHLYRIQPSLLRIRRARESAQVLGSLSPNVEM